jgi:hypothetical protein
MPEVGWRAGKAKPLDRLCLTMPRCHPEVFYASHCNACQKRCSHTRGMRMQTRASAVQLDLANVFTCCLQVPKTGLLRLRPDLSSGAEFVHATAPACTSALQGFCNISLAVTLHLARPESWAALAVNRAHEVIIGHPWEWTQHAKHACPIDPANVLPSCRLSFSLELGLLITAGCTFRPMHDT